MQMLFEVVNVLITIRPKLFSRFLGQSRVHLIRMNLYHQNILIITTVKNANPPTLRQTLRATPQEVVL